MPNRFRDRDVYGLTGQIDPAFAGKRLDRDSQVCSSMQECVRSAFERLQLNHLWHSTIRDR